MGFVSIQNRSQNRAQPPRRLLLAYIPAKRGRSLPRLSARLLLRRCIHCASAHIFHHRQQHQLRPPRGAPRPPRSILRLSPFSFRRSQLHPSEPPSSHQQHPSTLRLVGLFPMALLHPPLPSTTDPPGLTHARASHTWFGDSRTPTYIGQSAGEERQKYRSMGMVSVGPV